MFIFLLVIGVFFLLLSFFAFLDADAATIPAAIIGTVFIVASCFVSNDSVSDKSKLNFKVGDMVTMVRTCEDLKGGAYINSPDIFIERNTKVEVLEIDDDEVSIYLFDKKVSAEVSIDCIKKIEPKETEEYVDRNLMDNRALKVVLGV